MEAHENEIWSMTGLRSERTSLPNGIAIWIYSQGPSQPSGPPRIKVSKIRGKFPTRDLDYFSVSISEMPRVCIGSSDGFPACELEAIFTWVRQNMLALLDFWHSDSMDYEDIKSLLTPLND